MNDAQAPNPVYEQEIHLPDKPDGVVERRMKEVSFGRKHKLDEILDKINDPQSDPAEISRLIAVDIAEVAKEMADNTKDPAMQWLQKAYEIQIKALRELGKQLSEAEILSHKDVLNWDGAKFQFVLIELMKLYKQALRDAGVEDSLAQNVLKHYRDLLGKNDVRIRRDMDKQVGSNTR